ncbi:MAG TPA: flagellin, partial [Sumerlaeia bacterium]|nr:flagellin [Sumerlaeia bacterium]
MPGLVINTNVPSINGQRNLHKSTLALNKAMERLSSGLRINRAGDDAAGLAISENLRTRIRGLNQAVRNADDGISLIQTAEGAIDTYTEISQRIRQLAVQASSDVNSDDNRASIQLEINEQLDE